MSQTLGEKLREAREDRGISISEVAEQTRISPHYIESIELDDYKPLPGGIFNKGFVKSFAKYVGVNEQEALADYSRAIAAKEGSDEADLKVYKPEVLTDDSSARSMIPTIIIAALILGLMTAGILFGLNYLNAPADQPKAANTNSGNANSNTNGAPSGSTTDSSVPDMATLKVEFKTTQQVRLVATVDGEKSDNVVAAGSPKLFEPKDSLTLNYNRWNSSVVQLTLNGKTIALPNAPLSPADKDRINFTISKENLAQVWTSGSISGEVPPATPPENNAGTPSPATGGPTPVKPTPAAKPSVTANTSTTTPAKTPETKPAATPKPAPTTAKPAANGPN